MTEPAWKRYEDTARILLMKLREELNLDRIEGKQTAVGDHTEWELDAKGIRAGAEGAFVVIEVRRYTKSRIPQSQVGALAFTIKDTGAVGGIMVSPLPLQTGAQRIAQAENIVHVELGANSTPEVFAMRFLSQVMVGVKDQFAFKAEFTATVIQACQTCGTNFTPLSSEMLCPPCTSKYCPTTA